MSFSLLQIARQKSHQLGSILVSAYPFIFRSSADATSDHLSSRTPDSPTPVRQVGAAMVAFDSTRPFFGAVDWKSVAAHPGFLHEIRTMSAAFAGALLPAIDGFGGVSARE
jgi:hypothetical protein